tara:strand:- start:3989 stop:5656 length:1668 start_codon:yes stop_codon:yes gene_type:complete
MARADSILSGSLIFREDGVVVSKLVPNGGEIQVTGSLHVDTKIKLQGTDLGQRMATVENAVSTPSVTVGGLTEYTGSLNVYTASSKVQVGNLEAISASYNTFTGSTNISISNLESTASITSLTQSLIDTRLSSIEGKELISSSAQIDSIGFLSSSIQGIVSRSAQITELGFITASRFSEILEVPDGIVSSSAQLATAISGAGAVTFVTSSNFSLKQLQVNDYDSNVAAVFDDGSGKLTLTFGEPAQPTSVSLTTSGFDTDRFNQTLDSYNISATWNNGGYTLLTASIFEGNTFLTQSQAGTSILFSTSSIGNHSYRLAYTASSPLDGTLYKETENLTKNLSKSNPSNPSLSTTPSVQLGYSSNQIEQGATGSITITSSSSATSNQWQLDRTESTFKTPYAITGSATGSTTISIAATAHYDSPSGDNSPDTSTTRTTTNNYTKIRSVRFGASTSTAFTSVQLADLSLWDTNIGGTVGTIDKGNTNPSGDAVTISFAGDKYHYIVYDSSRSNLSNISTSGFGVIGQFTLTTVGDYKIYRTNTLQAGGSGSSITYNLT